ncbi:hypothetical protein T08_6896, partial [Trichinella sp. T8]
MSCNNTKSGSSECTCNVSQKCQQQICFRPTRSSRSRLIRRGLRERKETIEQLKILYLPITFGVSEKRLRGQILDEMRSDTPPR